MLADLLLSSQANSDYENTTQILASERDILSAEIMPLRSENRRLVRENNQLHLEMIRQSEDFERREQGWTVAMKKNEGDAKDAKFLSIQNSKLVEKYENELLGLRSRLAKSLERNLVAERPGISLIGGLRGDPVMLSTGAEGTHEQARSRYPEKGSYPQALEWSGTRQNIEMNGKVVPSPKKRAPDPGGLSFQNIGTGSTTTAAGTTAGTGTGTGVGGLSVDTSSSSFSATTTTNHAVVTTLTASLKAAHGDIERIQQELDSTVHTSRRAVSSRDNEINRLSSLIEQNGLSIVGGGINPPLMSGGNSEVSTHRQQTVLIEQLNDQIDYQNEQLAKQARKTNTLKQELSTFKNNQSNNNNTQGKVTSVASANQQDEEITATLKLFETQTIALKAELHTTQLALRDSETEARRIATHLIQLRESSTNYQHRLDQADRQTLTQSSHLKQATDELLSLRSQVQKYKAQEILVASQWEQGQTSNAHGKYIKHCRLTFLFLLFLSNLLHCLCHVSSLF